MVENVFGILVSRFTVPLGTMEQKKAKGCQRHCFYICGFAQHAEDTPDRAPTPANDVTPLENEQVVYVPNDNYRNPSREAKHQQELLKDYFDHMGVLAGQEDRI